MKGWRALRSAYGLRPVLAEDFCTLCRGVPPLKWVGNRVVLLH